MIEDIQISFSGPPLQAPASSVIGKCYNKHEDIFEWIIEHIKWYNGICIPIQYLPTIHPNLTTVNVRSGVVI